MQEREAERIEDTHRGSQLYLKCCLEEMSGIRVRRESVVKILIDVVEDLPARRSSTISIWKGYHSRLGMLSQVLGNLRRRDVRLPQMHNLAYVSQNEDSFGRAPAKSRG
jgi:hypothetical protein